ncbi:MAG: hypothetical protein LBS88_12270 [Tannerellaceae bacterium]|jgi:hypothetical protein|nr:hypothetical protein [Tannerellaceae bacterium]
MKGKGKSTIRVWLLAALLLLPFTIKSAHIHHYDICSEHAGAAHDCDNCPICQFMLSAYSEPESSELTPIRTQIAWIPAIPQEKNYIRAFLSPHLRAPPIAVLPS